MHQFKEILPNLKVICKASSEDKNIVLTGFKRLKFVCASTGDETGDVKTLKKAHIGFGLAKSGNEVIRQAANIILLDDSFLSIIPCLIYGKN